MKAVRTEITELLKMPGKAVMTLITVGVGVGVLILALSISASFAENVTEKLNQEGLIVTFANAGYSEEGGLEPVRPTEFDLDLPDLVRMEVSGVTAIAPITNAWWRIVTVGDKRYQLRRVVATGPEYAEIMGLEMLAGSFFSQDDVDNGVTKAVISESTAKIVFGSVEAAVGGIVKPPARNIQMQNSDGTRERQQVQQNFLVSGVFADPVEVQRKAYGIADVIIPYTGVVPGNQNLTMALRFLLTTMIMKVEGSSMETVESQLRSVLSREYDEDISLYVWEGEPNGETALIEETRETVATFSLIVNLLGFVLLITGSIGILSIMIVEILGRTKEIALERALGASKRMVITEFFTRSLVMSGLAAIVGIILSLVFTRPLSQLLWPIFRGIGISIESTAVISPTAILIGVGSALVIGGIFGTLPVFSTLKAPISESIREA